MSQLGIEANTNRESLRKAIDDKLEDSISRQTTAGHELREELNSSFRTLGANVHSVLETSNQQQKERLEDTAKALSSLTEQHSKMQEALRQTVQDGLSAIRIENAEKLDAMRLTVDEKLQTTLDNRLTESFSKIGLHPVSLTPA